MPTPPRMKSDQPTAKTTCSGRLGVVDNTAIVAFHEVLERHHIRSARTLHISERRHIRCAYRFTICTRPGRYQAEYMAGRCMRHPQPVGKSSQHSGCRHKSLRISVFCGDKGHNGKTSTSCALASLQRMLRLYVQREDAPAAAEKQLGCCQ